MGRHRHRNQALGCAMAVLTPVACGGKSSEDRPDVALTAGGDTASAAGGVTASAAGGVTASAGGAIGGVSDSCPVLQVSLNPMSPMPKVSGSVGVSVEPLQVPTSFEMTEIRWEKIPDPSTWDHSPVPAGACVYRLRGLNAACYGQIGTMRLAACEAKPTPEDIMPFEFHEVYPCSSGVQPGCPTADANTIAPGNWWYLTQTAPDEANLVVCAPACLHWFHVDAACLIETDSRKLCQ